MPPSHFALTRRARFFLLIAGIVILLGIADWFSVLEEPKAVLVRVFSPFASLPNRMGVWVAGRAGIGGNGEGNIEELREERDWLLSELVRLKEVERENALLRKELDIGQPEEVGHIVARVIGRDSSGVGDGIIVNRGRRDGVSKEDFAAMPGRVLVGKVTRASERTANIMLIDDPQSRIEVRFQTSRATGILKGDFGLMLLVDLIPRDTPVREGEIVLTAGLDGAPAGLFVGRVSSLEKSDGELFYQARVNPAANLQRIEEVFIISSPSLE